jgi:hypothetical protein
LTTLPNATVKVVHEKAMPVILRTAEEIDVWMNAPASVALKLQKPLPNNALKIVLTEQKRMRRWSPGSATATAVRLCFRAAMTGFYPRQAFRQAPQHDRSWPKAEWQLSVDKKQKQTIGAFTPLAPSYSSGGSAEWRAVCREFMNCFPRWAK